MNESAAKSFDSTNSRSFDMEEYEARLRSTQPRPPGDDPLIELATLVNSAEDPFADLFAGHGTANQPSATSEHYVPAAASAEPAQYAPAPVTVRPAAPSPIQPVAPVGSVPEVDPALDPLAEFTSPSESYPDEAPAILRSVADQMRSPQADGQQPAPVHQEHNDAQSALAVPSATVLQESSQALANASAHQPSGLPVQDDPVDEFERSIMQLIAARDQAEAYPDAAASAALPAAAPMPAGHLVAEAPSAPVNYDDQNAAPPVPPEDAYSPQDWQAAEVSQEVAVSAGHEQGYSDAYAEPDASTPSAAIPPEWLGDGEAPAPAALGTQQKRSRKSFFLTGSALAVLVVGIGGAFALRDSGGKTGEVPTITASADKMKVKAKPGAEKTVRTVSVLQNGKAASQPSKVVQNGEQPIDLAQVPAEPKKARRIKEEELSKKLNLADRNMARPIAASPVKIQSRRQAGGYFPEPRKVRTVMVRPDGSLIDPTASIAKPRAAAPSAARTVSRPRTVAPASVEQPSSDRSGDAAAPTVRKKSVSRAKTITAKPARRARAPAKRRAALDLTPQRVRNAGRTPPVASGGYAVQLAAPASENAARSVAKRLGSRFSSVLGGRSPGVVRAVVKSRTVYRVRVGGLSRGSATKMCSRLKAKGGRCFVARN